MIRRPPRSTLFPYTNALPISKQLLGFEFRFARACAPQQANMQHNDVFSAGLDAVQHSSQMIERMEVTDRDENVRGLDAEGCRREFLLRGHVELIHFDVSLAALVHAPL